MEGSTSVVVADIRRYVCENHIGRVPQSEVTDLPMFTDGKQSLAACEHAE
jgi:hypothetical protein